VRAPWQCRGREWQLAVGLDPDCSLSFLLAFPFVKVQKTGRGVPMLSRFAQCVVLFTTVGLAWSCGGQPAAPPPAATTPQPPPPPADDVDPADDAVPARTFRTADVLAKLLPSNGTGCAPNTRFIWVTSSGRPQASGNSIARC
jgi:hypothetical protein